MRSNKWFWLVIAAWLGGTPMASAMISSSRSYARLSSDGKRLLVMTTGKSMPHEWKREIFRLPDGRELALSEIFRKSGVYEVGSLAPVWQVDWYAYEINLRVSPDLDSMAVVFGHALQYPEEPALSFFHQGKPIREYGCHQLLGRLRSKVFFKLTNVNWHLDWYEEFETHGDYLTFITAQRTFGPADWSLNLGYQDAWVFDLRTGLAVEHGTLGAFRLAMITLAVAALFAVPGLIVFHRRRKRVKSS
ncbi:MAG: hypothetical protein EOP86_09465 [Verrucomicrobiaceae bacterium]|nr:MAG: hypothetical protein EOP86_09465 [Verrucomicrobiaceae bacterium]